MREDCIELRNQNIFFLNNFKFFYLWYAFVGYAQIELYLNYSLYWNVNIFVKFLRGGGVGGMQVPCMGFSWPVRTFPFGDYIIVIKLKVF